MRILNSIKFWLVIGLISFFVSGCEAKDALQFVCDENIDISSFYGEYNITEVIRYRGGLTLEKDAKSSLGKIGIITSKKFNISGIKVENPKYILECNEVNFKEGEVPSGDAKHWTNFYGHGTDRTVIAILKVYDKNIWKSQVEIISNGEAWDPYDGFIYKFKKQGH